MSAGTKNSQLSMAARKGCVNRQHGMALIIVLWLIVLLGIIAAGHAKNVHSETRMAMRHVEAAKARALAEAGIQRAIIDLVLPNNDVELNVNGKVMQLDIDGREVFVAVRDASGLVDLNTADAGLLGQLLTVTGADGAEREAIADAILDWRDADNLAHLQGAEGPDYLAAGLAWTPRNAAFASIDELRFVRGMTMDNFMAIAPYLTVYSHRAGLNLEYAPPTLVSILTGKLVEPATGMDASPYQSQPGKSPAVSRNGTYHINAGVAGNGDVFASLEVAVEISASTVPPFTILYRREPARFRFPAMEKR